MKIFVGKIRIHPLLPVFWFISYLMIGPALLPMLLALLLHEAGHLAAARYARIPVDEIELTPFGGVISIREIETASSLPVFWIASGGPLASALGCALSPLFTRLFSEAFARPFARTCMSLLVINLVPALPLDGGRMLRAALCRFLPYQTATRWLIRTGYALGGLLCGASLLSAWQGQLRFSPAFAGLYLIYAAALEGRQGTARYLDHLIARRQKIEGNEILPVEIWAAGKNTPVPRLIQKLNAGKYHMVYVLSDDGMQPLAFLNEETLCSAVLRDNCHTLEDCMKKGEA